MNYHLLAIMGAKETSRQRGARLRKGRLSAAREIASHTKEEWAELVIEFGGKCVRCGNSGAVQKDHIIPIYQGGSDGIDNLQPLCKSCNASKGPDSFNWVSFRRKQKIQEENNG